MHVYPATKNPHFQELDSFFMAMIVAMHGKYIKTKSMNPKAVTGVNIRFPSLSVSVRSRFAGDEGQKSLDVFIQDLKEEIAGKVQREVEREEE